jgi:hypothetical protein
MKKSSPGKQVSVRICLFLFLLIKIYHSKLFSYMDLTYEQWNAVRELLRPNPRSSVRRWLGVAAEVSLRAVLWRSNPQLPRSFVLFLLLPPVFFSFVFLGGLLPQFFWGCVEIFSPVPRLPSPVLFPGR